MSIAYKCDRCGEFMERAANNRVVNEVDGVFVVVRLQKKRDDDCAPPQAIGSPPRQVEQLHLCESCAGELRRVAHN